MTDVITFDTSDQFSSVRGQLEGEIFISTDAARQNARLHKTTEDNELTLYIVHGILHLLGYDDHSKNDIKKMRDKEIQVMTYL
ncbi:MAG: putative rRNA maturation factor [Lysobacterales bacterium]